MGRRANPARACIFRSFCSSGPIRSFASMPVLVAPPMNLRRASRIRGSHLQKLPQPVNFAIQVALAELWRSWGIEPDGVVGHSVGEVAAAYVSGALGLDDAVKVSLHRSRVQAKASGSGGMLAVGLAADDMARCLNGLADRAVIAAVNSRSSCTVSGDPDALRDLASRLTSQNIFNRFLKVDIAYHSPQMEPLEPELIAALDGIQPLVPHVPLYSTVTGQRSQSALCDAGYWWQNVRRPVLFEPAINEMIAHGYEAFLEIGPHPVLASSIDECLRTAGKTGKVLPSLYRLKPEQPSILYPLGELNVAGYPIDWKRLYPGGGRLVRLPRYPWQRERHWCESVESREDRLGAGIHPLLDRPLHAPQPAWEVELTAAMFPFLAHHRVQETPVFPGAGYVEACIAAALEIERRPSDAVVVEDLSFRKALVLGSAEGVSLHVGFEQEERVISIHGRIRGKDEPWTLHATARIRERRGSEVQPAGLTPEDLRKVCPEPYAPGLLYRELSAVGLDYGPMFQSIEGLWLGRGEVIAEIALPRELERDLGRYHLHPVLLDASFQALLAAALGNGSDNRVFGGNLYLPVQISRVAYYSAAGSRIWCHGRIREMNSLHLIGDIQLLDEAGNLLADVRGFKCQALFGHQRSEAERSKEWLYEVKWRTLAAPDFGGNDYGATDSGRSENPRRIETLIFTDRGGIGTALADELQRHEQSSIVVSQGSSCLQIDSRHYQINPTRPDDIDWLFEHVNSQSVCGRIVYLWGLDIDTPAGSAGLSEKQAGLEDCVSVMHLVQGLVRASWDQPPRIWLLTRGAVEVDERESQVVPGRFALWGLGRVIDLEHPELRCSLLDLDASAPDLDLSLVRAELDCDGPESELAHRGGVRHGLRLVRALESREDTGRSARMLDSNASYRLEFTRTGSFDSLFFRECPREDPGRGEVEVRVKATGLNYKDVMKVMGLLSEEVIRDTWSGRTLGLECAGVITRVGPDVSPARVGEEVQGWVADGFRTYITGRNEQFVPRFDGLSSAEAAAVPVVFLTAYYGLKEIARVRRGERVLIHAATGGVGLAAIQVARALGAEVFATAGSPEKRDYLRRLGVQHVMDSRSLDFADQILEWTNERGVDVVLNSLTGEAAAKSFSILAPYGRFIEIGKRDIDADHALRLNPFNRYLLFAAFDLDRLLLDRPDEIARMEEELEGFVPARSIVTAANHGLSRKGRRERVPAVGPGAAHRQGRCLIRI